jgi:DNA repair exonuclease SbcCD ATPase subunit
MIDDEQYPSFKFEGDEEPVPEQTVYQDEAKDRRVEKLSHRVTIITILLPVLIGVIFYIAYRDVTSRVSQSQDVGAMEIQNLTGQLEENFAALSAKYGELEAALNEKLANLEKVDKAMKDNLKQAEDTVAKINATKADKKDQQQVVAKIDAALTPIRKELKDLSAMRTDIKTVSTEMADLDKDVQQQFTSLSGKVDKALNDLKQIQTEVSSVSNRKMDKEAMQLELLKARKNFQRDLDVAKAAIDKRIDTMLRKIKDLEKLAEVPTMSPKPSGNAVSQGAGSITEQEIKE